MATGSTQRFFTTFDTLSMLSSDLILDDAINTIEACKKNGNNASELNEIERKRVDPKTLFAQLTDNPLEFMEQMIDSDTILSGSRAVHYIYPYFDCKESDWDFYSEVAPKWCGFDEFLQSIGAVLNERDIVSSNKYARFNTFSIRRYTLEHNSKKHDIQLMHPINQTSTAFSIIMNFHSTAVQCFITGYAAVSMYHVLNMNKKNMDWSACKTKPGINPTIKKTIHCKVHKLEVFLTECPTVDLFQLRLWIKMINRLQMEYIGRLHYYEADDEDMSEEVHTRLTAQGVYGIITQLNNILPNERQITMDTFIDCITSKCTCEEVDTFGDCINKYASRGFKLMNESDIQLFKSKYVDEEIVTRGLHENEVSKVFPLLDYIDNSEIRRVAARKLKKLYCKQWYEVVDKTTRGTVSTEVPNAKRSAINWCKDNDDVYCPADDMSPDEDN